MPPQEACSVHRRGRLRHLIRGVLLRHPERGPHVVRCDNGVTPEHRIGLAPGDLHRYRKRHGMGFRRIRRGW